MSGLRTFSRLFQQSSEPFCCGVSARPPSSQVVSAVCVRRGWWVAEVCLLVPVLQLGGLNVWFTHVFSIIPAIVRAFLLWRVRTSSIIASSVSSVCASRLVGCGSLSTRACAATGWAKCLVYARFLDYSSNRQSLFAVACPHVLHHRK